MKVLKFNEFLNEAKLEPGTKVQIIAPKNQQIDRITKQFIGKTGKIQSLEDKRDKLWRVNFDETIDIEGVGKVQSDLFQPQFFKILESLDEKEKMSLSIDTMVDNIYKELKNEKNWVPKALEKIKKYTKDRTTITSIMNMLHDEDHFDDEMDIEEE